MTPTTPATPPAPGVPTDITSFLAQYGDAYPPVVFVVGLIFVASLLSERVSKILGPLGKVGRWWRERQQREEATEQANYEARRKRFEAIAADQIRDLENELHYFRDAVEQLRTENRGLRDELHTVHRLLDDTRRQVDATRTEVGETSRMVAQVSRQIDTGERLALLPPPPPPIARHREPEPDETARIYPTTRG